MKKEEKYYIQKIRQTIGKAINQYDLIKDGDRILLGISGGKDSFVLLESLALRRKYIPINYEIYAVHVNITSVPYEIDKEYYENYCKELGVHFLWEEDEVDLEADKKKSPCFICSWQRRKVLFTKAKELNCNKLALGHHVDDSIETMLMNMIYHGTYSAMAPSLSMFDDEIQLIRPMLLLNNEELKKYALLRNFPIEKKECPYSDETKRASVKNIVAEMEKLNPSVRKNLFNAMSKICTEYLPPRIEHGGVKEKHR